jgi:hypothetical protein
LDENWGQFKPTALTWLKAKFTVMEEMLKETSGNVGVVGRGRMKKSARVRQWVKQHNKNEDKIGKENSNRVSKQFELNFVLHIVVEDA